LTTRQIEFNYDDVPTVRKFALSNKRIRGLMSPVGSGKSSGCVVELARRAHEQAPMLDGIRRTRWAIVRNTYRQLEDTTIKTVHDWLPPDLYGDWNKTDHNYTITAFPGVEIQLMFRALDRPDQLANLLSLEITGAWLNEYREIPKIIFDVLDTRVGRYPPKREVEATWMGIIMDTNPPDENNPFYKYFEKTRPSNAQLWKQPSGLSPHAENIPNLPRGYYQNLIKGKDDQFINVYAHGLYGYVVEGKPVYGTSYNDNTHVSPNTLHPIKGLPLITGWDFGLNPSVVIGQMLPTSRVMIYRAISSDGMGLEKFLINQILPMLKQEFFGYRIIGFGDPAGTQRVQTDEKTCYDIFKENGLELIEQAPSNNLVARQRAVESQLSRSVFGEQAVVIDPEQDILRKALSSGYRFKVFPNGEASETPDKNYYSHIANAFEYFCMFLGDNKGREEREQQMRKTLSMIPQYKHISSIAGY
jgi:acyl carrier protein phosphodiesterase